MLSENYAAMSILLIGAVALKLLMARALVPLHLLQAAKVATWGWEMTGKHLLMLAVVAPTHASFNLFLWNSTRQSELKVMVAMPLCLIPVLMAEIPAMRLLGVYGIIGGLGHLYAMRKLKREGLRMI